MIYDEKCEAGIRLASFSHPLPSCACVSTFGSLLRQENGEVGESVKQSQADDGGPCVPISWRAATEAVSTGRFSKTCYSTSAEQTEFEHPPVTSRITFV